MGSTEATSWAAGGCFRSNLLRQDLRLKRCPDSVRVFCVQHSLFITLLIASALPYSPGGPITMLSLLQKDAAMCLATDPVVLLRRGFKMGHPF